MLKKLFILALSAATSLFFLTACGFKPLHADRSINLRTVLQSIELTPITQPKLAGFTLEKALRRNLDDGATTKYRLDIKLRDRRTGSAVTSLANTIQFNYILDAEYTLTDIKSGTIYKDTIQAITSYGTTSSQYSTHVAQERAIERAAIDIAERIKIELLFFLKRQSSES